MEELKAESQQSSESSGTIGRSKGASISSSQQQISVTVVTEFVRWNEEAISRSTLFSSQVYTLSMLDILRLIKYYAKFRLQTNGVLSLPIDSGWIGLHIIFQTSFIGLNNYCWTRVMELTSGYSAYRSISIVHELWSFILLFFFVSLLFFPP